MTNTPTPPTNEQQIDHDCDPDTDEDTFNHRHDDESNVEPASEKP